MSRSDEESTVTRRSGPRPSRAWSWTGPGVALFALAAAGCDPGTTPVPEGGLQLGFNPVAHDLDFSLVTDIEFARSPADELIVTDLAGGFAHLRLKGDALETLSQGAVEVYVDGAAGLVGTAVDPDFEHNHFIYLALCLTKQKNAIRRYTLDDADPQATLDSMVTILEIEADSSPRWHNITSLGFEPDGVLWALVGDKGLFTPAQDVTAKLGSLIRIVPSREEGVDGYTIPEGAELFAPDADPAVYSKGIRSPWKGLLHDGKWYYGEVGLDDIEEINVIDGPKENFGWPLVEGPCALDILETAPTDCSDQFVDPWIYYDRSSSHTFVADDLDAVPTNQRSVYAGWIYQPNDKDPYKGRWDDVLVFGDTYVGFMRAKPLKGDAPDYPVGHLQWASGWAQGPDGFVYVTSLDDFPADGALGPSPIYRVVLEEE